MQYTDRQLSLYENSYLYISTVFLGEDQRPFRIVDHNDSNDGPILFETMVFFRFNEEYTNNRLSELNYGAEETLNVLSWVDFYMRYRSYYDAICGHDKVVFAILRCMNLSDFLSDLNKLS